MTVIMAVTADKYELPLAVMDKQREMADCLGYTEGGVSKAIITGNALQRNPFNEPVRLIRVNIDEED